MDDAATRRPHHAALLDPHGRIHRFERDGTRLAGKRRPRSAGRREFERATEARRRLASTEWPAPFPVEVVVPEFTEADDLDCLLVAPDLGEPLATDLDLAGRLLPRSRLIAVLRALLNTGIEASGFIPRNLFHRDGRLYVIDWEDAAFAEPPARPAGLTVMKWDIAWSDAFKTDPQLRFAFAGQLRAGPQLDTFEQALAELTGADRDADQIRADGIALTLASELHVPGTTSVTAAELGHLADEVLPAPHSVLYTALTAWLRTTAGEQTYARFIESVWRAVRDRSVILGSDRAADTVAVWLRAIYTAVDACLARQPSLAELHEHLAELGHQSGWSAALRRAELAEDFLARVSDFVVSAFGLTELQLILRGSLAQGSSPGAAIWTSS